MIRWLFGYIGYLRAEKMYQLLMLANNAGMLPNGLVHSGTYCLYANKYTVNYIVELYNNGAAYGLMPTNELYQQVHKAKSNYIKMWVLVIIGLVLAIFGFIAALFITELEDTSAVIYSFLGIIVVMIIALIISYIGAHYSKKNKQLLEYLVTYCNRYFYPDYQPLYNQTKAVVIPPQSTNNRA